MRTLHTTEINLVSGAGKLADNGATLGKAFGGLFDAFATILGTPAASAPKFGESFGLVGSAFGSFAEMDIEAGIKNLVSGITTLISSLTPAKTA